MVKMLAAAIGLALAACNYNASFRDCTIRCSLASGCPSGFVCGGEGLCRPLGTSVACSATPADASGADASGADAKAGGDATAHQDAPSDVVMDENEDSTPTEAAPGCNGPATGCSPLTGSGSPFVMHWYREFALHDPPHWDLGGSFQITSVHFGCYQASSPRVVVNVYRYPAAMLYQSTIDMTQWTLVGSAGSAGSPVTIPSCPAEDIEVPITASPIPAGGAFVVEVEETDYVQGNGNGLCVSNGKFRLASNAAGEFHPSYFYENELCQTGSAYTTPTMWPESFVLGVRGVASP